MDNSKVIDHSIVVLKENRMLEIKQCFQTKRRIRFQHYMDTKSLGCLKKVDCVP